MIILRSFTGAYPVIPSHLLPEDAAQYAKDVDVRNGELKGIYAARNTTEFSLPAGTLGAWTPDGYRFLTSGSPIRASLSPVVDDRWGRLYFTDSSGLHVCNQADLTASGSPVTTYKVGTPAPTAALGIKKVRKYRWPNYPNTALKLKFFLSANGQRFSETTEISPVIKSGSEPFGTYTFDAGVNISTALDETSYTSPGSSVLATSVFDSSLGRWIMTRPGSSTFVNSDGVEFTDLNGDQQSLNSATATKVTLSNGMVSLLDFFGSLAQASNDPTKPPSTASPSIEIWLENSDNSGERIWTTFAGTTASGSIDSFPGGASVSLTPTGSTTYQIDFNFGVVESRAYVYTFFNEWQEESQPSMPVSVDVSYLDDVELSVNLSNIPTLFSGHVKYDHIQFYCAGSSGNYLGIYTAPVTAANALSVTDLYHSILWREPDAEGLAYWTAQYAAGMSLSDIAAAFYQTREYQNQESYVAVEDVYQKLLNRSAEDAGFTFWRNAFENGASLQNVIWAILNSPEYLALHPTDEGAATNVNWWYQKFLGRNSDANAYWPPRIAADRQVLAGMLQLILTSAEYRSREANARVTALLTVVLHRTPTAAEVSSALSAYNNGQSFNSLSYQYASSTTNDYKDEGTRTGATLMSLEWAKPSPDLSMLTALPNGVFAAIKGREVHLSEPFMPYAWPTKYIQTLERDPVGSMSFNGQLLVTTTSNPIVISGAHPGGMTQQKIGSVEAGVSEYGMTVVSGMPVYASKDGIVTISGMSGSLDLSHKFWTSDKWREKYGSRLSTIKLIAHDGKLVGLFDSGDGFIVHYGANKPHLVEFSQTGGYPFTVPGREIVYLANTSGIKELFYYDASATPLTYTWWSKEFELPRYDSFSAAKIVSKGNVQLTFYGDSTPFYTYSVSTASMANTTIRLPDTAKYFRFSVKAVGTGTVQEIRAGNSMREMTRG